MTTEGALEALVTIKRDVPHEVVAGSGTVLTDRAPAAWIQAGADFLVVPSLAPEVVRRGLAASVAVCPGALTPSEFQAARAMDVDVVKLFPASVTAGLSGVLVTLLSPAPMRRG